MNNIICLKSKVSKILKGEYLLSKKQEILIGISLLILNFIIVLGILTSTLKTVPIFNHRIINSEIRINKNEMPIIKNDKIPFEKDYMLKH